MSGAAGPAPVKVPGREMDRPGNRLN